jgi:hypothetical protein
MSQTQVTPTKSVVSEAMTKGGYSKNTGMAMGLLRRELEVIEGEAAKKLEFDQIAQKVSLCTCRWVRAAADLSGVKTSCCDILL